MIVPTNTITVPFRNSLKEFIYGIRAAKIQKSAKREKLKVLSFKISSFPGPQIGNIALILLC